MRAMSGRQFTHDVRIAAFRAQVHKGPDCWEWTAGVNNSGYGQFSVYQRHVQAHRFSYELDNGPIPPGMEIRHTCDNRICVRPEHLLVGTRGDNMKDMYSRGRRLLPTHCPKGHAYTEANTMHRKRQRVCKQCMADYQRRYRATGRR